MLKKISIYSAFELYLDFINIFLYILRMLGNRDYRNKKDDLSKLESSSFFYVTMEDFLSKYLCNVYRSSLYRIL